MWISLDADSPLSLNRQISAQIRELILRGHLAALLLKPTTSCWPKAILNRSAARERMWRKVSGPSRKCADKNLRQMSMRTMIPAPTRRDL